MQVGNNSGAVGNDTGNATGSGGESGGGWFDWDLGIPGLEETATWAKDMLIEAYTVFLEVLTEFMLGTPTPENNGYLGIFGEPTGRFQPLYDSVLGDVFYPMLSELIFITLMLMVMVQLINSIRGKYIGGKLLFHFLAGVAIIAFGWTYISLVHHFVDALTLTIAPSPDELTATPAQALETLTSQLFVIGGMATLGIIQSLALVAIYGTRQAILHVGPVLFPFLLYLAYLGPHEYIRAAGSIAIWQYYAVLVYTLPVAVGLRFAHGLSWGLSADGFVNAIISLGLVNLMILGPVLISSALFFIPLILKLSSGADKRFNEDSYKKDHENGGDNGSSESQAETTTTTEKTETNSDSSNQTHRRHPTGGTPGTIADGGTDTKYTAQDIRQTHKRSKRSDPASQWDERTNVSTWYQ